ncbi:DnaB-like helicase C-terminal domain-containing protein [Streptomyces levis]
MHPEQLLISAILNQGDHVTPGAMGITPSFFHAFPDEYKFIYEYVKTHRRTPSRMAFRQKFRNCQLSKTADDVAHFCNEVITNHAQAVILEDLQDVIELVKDGDVKKAISLMNRTAVQSGAMIGGSADNEDIITDNNFLYNEVKARQERRKLHGSAGIPTGFPTLDDRTGGIQPGQFWVIAARLGEGKSWTLVRMACAAIFGGYNVQYNSLEMLRADIAMRVITFVSSEHGQGLFKAIDQAHGMDFSLREYKQFLADLRNNVKAAFRVNDQSRGPISLATMEAQAQRHQPDIYYLDYLQLMNRMGNDEEDWQPMANISGGVKNFCNRYMIPVVTASQLNREAAKTRELAGPENIAESDAIGRDADVVVTMRQLSQRVIVMKLAKNRGATAGFVWYTEFLPNTGYFREIDFNRAQELMDEDKAAANEALPQSKVTMPNQSNGNGGFTPIRKSPLEKPDENPKPRRVIRRSTDS